MVVRKRKAPKPRGRSASAAEGPSYRKPPVDEVVCGIRFEPLAAFKMPYAGLLWEKFRANYPTIEHVAPIVSDGSVAIDVATGAPLPRLWFSNESGDELIQFQVDRFYYNWRRRNAEYPRFRQIFPRFEEVKADVEKVLATVGLGPLVVMEHELTYINHIAQGEGWDTAEDVSQIVPLLAPNVETLTFLPAPKNIAWTMRFDFPVEQGRLDIRLSHGIRRTDKRPLVMLNLSAKGKPSVATWDASREWFNMAHEWIVKGFADITSPQLQKAIWERVNG